ncbi:MAG: hypothetical protein ACREH4_09280, partial [Vitreimonas sp.]
MMMEYDEFHEVERLLLQSAVPHSRQELHAFLLARGPQLNDDFHYYFLDRLSSAESHEAISAGEFYVLFGGTRSEDYEEDFAETDSLWDGLEAEYLLASLPRRCIASFVRECVALAERFKLSMHRGEVAVSPDELQADFERIAT